MPMLRQLRIAMAAAAIPTNLIHAAMAQTLRMTTPIAPGLATPNLLDNSIGPPNLSAGFPAPARIETIYDNLDRSRALQTYLLAITMVNEAGRRESLRKLGPANDNMVDCFIWLDTMKAPLGGGGPIHGLGVVKPKTHGNWLFFRSFLPIFSCGQFHHQVWAKGRETTALVRRDPQPSVQPQHRSVRAQYGAIGKPDELLNTFQPPC
jgi:hypothetical protein